MKLTQQLASTTLTPLLRLNQSRLLERSERERGHDPEYKKEGKNCRQIVDWKTRFRIYTELNGRGIDVGKEEKNSNL